MLNNPNFVNYRCVNNCKYEHKNNNIFYHDILKRINNNKKYFLY